MPYWAFSSSTAAPWSIGLLYRKSGRFSEHDLAEPIRRTCWAPTASAWNCFSSSIHRSPIRRTISATTRPVFSTSASPTRISKDSSPESSATADDNGQKYGSSSKDGPAGSCIARIRSVISLRLCPTPTRRLSPTCRVGASMAPPQHDQALSKPSFHVSGGAILGSLCGGCERWLRRCRNDLSPRPCRDQDKGGGKCGPGCDRPRYAAVALVVP